MNFRKVVIDGKEYYEKCEDREAQSVEKNECEVEDRKENFLGEVGAFFEKIGVGAKDLGGKMLNGTKDLGRKIKEETERIWNKNKGISPDSREGRLIKLLPYMDTEDARAVCEMLLSDEKLLSKIDTALVIPYLPPECAEKIFEKTVELMEETDVDAIIKYVSPTCLRRVVDAFLAGKYPKLDIDILYPYLEAVEIKRIAAYLSAKEG